MCVEQWGVSSLYLAVPKKLAQSPDLLCLLLLQSKTEERQPTLQAEPWLSNEAQKSMGWIEVSYLVWEELGWVT